ncbi:hypothetical protein [Mycolicibacterium sp. 624]|uniref:hypothetical protein n=1 Tax=Mycolicibacterium sp. 624 TaxID=3156314 RepID=UPI003395798A
MKSVLLSVLRGCDDDGVGSWGETHGDVVRERDAAAAFATALEQFAEESGAGQLTPLISRLRSPVCVAVRGRRGAGVATMRAALTIRGVCTTPDPHADVRVLVAVEALKPEERARLAAGTDTIVVLNKADLCRALPDGPMAEANRRAGRIQADTGVPTIAMSALLAVAGCGPMEDETLRALRVLTRAPADLSSVDAFVTAEHHLSAHTRECLLQRLDRFGVAHAVRALTRGADAARLPEVMSELSNVDALLAALRSASAAVRYRRVREAIIELRCLAMQSGLNGLLDWLAGDEPVLAAMAAAVNVLESDGLLVDPGVRPDAHRSRALHWRRYGRGCVGALHRDCSADVVRGSLRLLGEPR